MARQVGADRSATELEKRKLQEEKKRFKRDQKLQRKEAKRRAAEIARHEEALEDGSNPLVTIGATLLIVVLWLAVICIIIKLDIGGFGSTVLTPLLKDVPVVNQILPGEVVTETNKPESYGGYTSLQDAVNQIRQLEQQLERVQAELEVKNSDIDLLKAENERLSEFEKAQVEFSRIYTKFYEEVVNSDKSPGPEVYMEWYEGMNPTTAEYLYKQVLVQQQASTKVQEYAATYAAMDPKQAARAFEKLQDNLNLVAKILNAMSTEARAKVLDEMNSEVVAKLTKIMDPDS